MQAMIETPWTRGRRTTRAAASVMLLAVPVMALCQARAAETASAPPGAMTVPKTGSFTTPAALAERAKLCADPAAVFPKSWEWNPAQTRAQPRGATEADGLKPKVEQYRRGKLVAIYDYLGGGTKWGCYGDDFSARLDGIAASGGAPVHVEGCGPFWNAHQWRAFDDGDVFRVYPAVYGGPGNAVVLGPNVANTAEWPLAAKALQAWTARYGAALSAAASRLGQPTLDMKGIPRPPPFGHPLRDVTIQGVTVNGVRPVIAVTNGVPSGNAGLFIGENDGTMSPDSVHNLTIENIDVVNAGVSGLDAAIKIQNADGVTLRNMRISGFRGSGTGGMQGLATRAGIAGYLHIEGVIFDRDGGVQRNGTDAHNLYLGPSAWDKTYTVEMVHSSSHDTYWGHAFKSRAQNNILIGNYFATGAPDAGYPLGGSYLVDIPNGGRLVFKDNILVKNYSGDGTNGMALTYGMEHLLDNRANTIDIENNTFVAVTKYYDTQKHQVYPMTFGYPPVVPDARDGLVGMTLQDASGGEQPATIPASAITVARNLFVGFCPADDRHYAAVMGYRGAQAVVAGFADLGPDFALVHAITSDDASIIGQPEYTHEAQPGATRTRATIGARD